MQEFGTLQSKSIKILVDDIDTDQIIPARFLKTTDKLGLGKNLFSNWRYGEDGSENADFALNQEAMQGRTILLAGDNFGCGSSREHAPWALSSWGFRVIISTSFADIFRSNALKNGLLLIEVDAEQHALLVAAKDDANIAIDLAAQELTLAGGAPSEFPIDAFSKRCLLDGLDQLGYLQSFESNIEEYEKGR
ncbi:MAG: 3-isopropylmalate dehydratase small subunit [Myxococcales bacterium]|nr:3-isopropylmalate dehydratase small subunit [Myxococcales bacterium]